MPPVKVKSRQCVKVKGSRLHRITLTVESLPRVIQFDDIVEACEVVYDDGHNETPWDNCDGYDHDVRSPGTFEDEGIRKARGYCWSNSDRTYVVIELDDKATKGDYKYFRSYGMSKQSAREKVAQFKRNRLDQLTKWYSDGWNWYGVKCEFLDQEASVWGIDDDDYARKEVRPEIASEIAAGLRKEGFIVEGEPDRKSDYRSNRIHHMRLNLRMDCWID